MLKNPLLLTLLSVTLTTSSRMARFNGPPNGNLNRSQLHAHPRMLAVMPTIHLETGHHCMCYSIGRGDCYGPYASKDNDAASPGQNSHV